jgi:hypothetical protein
MVVLAVCKESSAANLGMTRMEAGNTGGSVIFYSNIVVTEATGP